MAGGPDTRCACFPNPLSFRRDSRALSLPSRSRVVLIPVVLSVPIPGRSVANLPRFSRPHPSRGVQTPVAPSLPALSRSAAIPRALSLPSRSRVVSILVVLSVPIPGVPFRIFHGSHCRLLRTSFGLLLLRLHFQPSRVPLRFFPGFCSRYRCARLRLRLNLPFADAASLRPGGAFFSSSGWRG